MFPSTTDTTTDSVLRPSYRNSYQHFATFVFDLTVMRHMIGRGPALPRRSTDGEAGQGIQGGRGGQGMFEVAFQPTAKDHRLNVELWLTIVPAAYRLDVRDLCETLLKVYYDNPYMRQLDDELWNAQGPEADRGREMFVLELQKWIFERLHMREPLDEHEAAAVLHKDAERAAAARGGR